MNEYRMYHLVDNRIRGVETFHASTDESALNIARSNCRTGSCEVWSTEAHESGARKLRMFIDIAKTMREREEIQLDEAA